MASRAGFFYVDLGESNAGILILVYSNTDFSYVKLNVSDITSYLMSICLSVSLSLSVHPSIYLQSFCWTWPLFQFLNPIHSRQDPLDGESVRRKASTYTQNKGTQTFMPRVRFERVTPVFERAKTVHVLDRAATVTGMEVFHVYLFNDALRSSHCIELNGRMLSE
jgi:hypothetical protein